MHDWNLKTNIDGIYVCGGALFGSDCAGSACATGSYAPLSVKDGMSWKELNLAITKAMQNYCGGIKCDALLDEGIDLLKFYEQEYVPQLSCTNPHDLMRIHEVLDILTISQVVLEACKQRKANCESLHFKRSDSQNQEERYHIILSKQEEKIHGRHVPLDYYGDIQSEYEKHNQDYIKERIVYD